MRYWGTDYLPIVWNMTGTAECCSEDECNDTREKKNTTTNMDTANNNKDTTASIEDPTTTEGGTTPTEDTTLKKDSAMEDTTMNAMSKEDTVTEASEDACSIDSDCNMVGAICVVKKEEEEEEDRVDLFVLFSSCRHLPVGQFFAISSSLSATKLGILTIRMISCWVAPGFQTF